MPAQTQIVPINLAPGAPTLDGTHLPRLIDLYLEARATRLDAQSIRGYRQKLRPFLTWWQAAGPGVDWLLTEAVMARFGTWLNTRQSIRGAPLSWHTRNDVLRRLKQVFAWAHGRGYIRIDFSQFVPNLKGKPLPPRPVDVDVVRALLDAAAHTRFPARNRALVAMLAGTAIRCEECAALRVDDVVVYADQCGYVGLCVAKNDNLRYVAFDSYTGGYLCAWLDCLPRAGPMFPSRKGGAALSPSGLYKTLVTLAQIAEVRDRVRGPHDLRRMFATLWRKTAKLPGDNRLLQEQMGHASFAVTLRYQLADVADVLEAMRERDITPMAWIANGTDT